MTKESPKGKESNQSTMAVPSGRGSRLARLGWMATGIAGSMVAEGARQLAQGNRPKMSDLLLTPANARKVADQLAKLRGAAMKVGHLVSLETGDLLPPALAEILARLRSNARAMPNEQVAAVLESNLGKGWEKRFKHFSYTPLAAASIGQVHRAETRDGRDLAIKIQYPGVRESIDSDVDNVAGLLRLSGLLPRELDIKPLLADAKRQLHEEADYLREGDYLQRYRDLLSDSPQYLLPKLHPDLTTHQVLAMDYVGGVPLETLVDASQAMRNRVTELLFGLLLREVFEFRIVQTDPNFETYRYDLDTQQLILLDFGATRPYKVSMARDFRRLITGAMTGDRDAMAKACLAIGYFDANSQVRHKDAVLNIGLDALEPFCKSGPYDFSTTDLPERVRSAGLDLGKDRAFWKIPPADAMLLQRKFGGLYLLAIRLKASVDIHALAQAAFASHGRSHKPD